MLLLLVALVVSVVASVALMWAGNSGYEGRHLVAFLFGMFLCAGSGLASVSYVFAGWNWLASGHKADIINREYGTDYTQAEVYWASDVIDTVRELDRKRIELNGNLMRGEEK